MASVSTPVEITMNKRQDGEFHLRIVDQISGIQVFSVLIPPEQIADLITGESIQMTGNFLGMDKVGKKCVSENREVICPLDACSKDILSNWVKENCQEDGWQFSYLVSLTRDDGKNNLCYKVHKYVDTNPVV